MPASSDLLHNIYNLLYTRYGPQHWWPGQGRLEIIVGAILTQNTNWKNVEKAISGLKSAGYLSTDKLHKIDINRLAELIRPAGYYNIKAKRLKNFIDALFERFDGNLDAMGNLETYSLRNELLSISGIGPETADSIILYAFEKTVFVVDAYTCRVFGRHMLIEPGSGYEQVQELAHGSLQPDTRLFNEYHALLIRLGKEHCKTQPICRGCPLESLPHQVEF